MAGEIFIKVAGDAAGLSRFFSATSRQVEDFVQRTSSIYSKEFSNLLGTKQFVGGFNAVTGEAKKYGSAILKVRQEYDQLQNSIRVTATSGFKLLDGTTIPVAQTRQWFGDMRKIVTEMETQARLMERIKGIEGDSVINRRALLRSQEQETAAIGAAATAQRNPLFQQLFAARSRREDLTEAIRDRNAYRTGQGYTGAVRTNFDAVTNTLVQERNALLGTELNLRKQLNATEATFAAEQAAADERHAAARTADRLATQSTLAPFRTQLQASREEEARLRTAPPTVPPEYTNIQSRYPQLARQLQAGGIASGTGALGDILRNQRMAEFSAPVKDLVTGVTRLSGAFTDNQGILNRWSAEVDKNGKLVTRFGGNLSGINKITEQISRNFQKVIEWTVATTIVFGTLSAAISALDTIKTLDADLARFGVTSELSAKQTSAFYKELLNVAQVTATPIEQLVKAADDFALAVKKPGQSTEELLTDVTKLSEAVGIFTNLTGEDTVSATDTLVATMKQLGLTTDDVFVVLNKVTAAAGGQSGAISDIAKGLSVMAEAGKQANLSVDQQIATVKVLSQVTSKSPAEIATAFKNLVGAIQNPAGIKALEKYGIELHDQEGQLRSLIDIYVDIQGAIQRGVVPSGEVSKLIRDISGGPRRAPDAAALLANINQVLKETRVSQDATNEAFLANAQIIDTLNAKFIVFQNTLKDKVFTTFGEVFRAVAITGIEFVTKLLDALSGIPKQFYLIGAQLIAFGVAFSLLSRIGGSVFSAFTGVTAALFGMAKAQQAATVSTEQLTLAMAEQNAVAAGSGGLGGRLGGIRGKYGGAIGGAIVGGVIGGGAALTSGGNLGQVIGTAGQGIGLGLLAAGPDPISKTVGAVVLLGSTLLQMATQEKEVQQESAETASSILQIYESAKSAGQEIAAQTDTLATLNAQIKGYHDSANLTKEDEAALIDLQQQRTTATLEMTAAQNELNTALSSLGELIPEVKGLLDASNFASSEELEKAIRHYQEVVLGNQFPGRTFPGGVLPPPNLIGQGEGERGTTTRLLPLTAKSSQVTYQRTTLQQNPKGRGFIEVPETVTTDLSKIAGDEGAINAVIKSLQDGQPIMELAVSNFDLLRKAISSLPDDKAGPLLEILGGFERQSSAVAQITDLLGIYDAAIQNIKPFNPEVSAELEKQKTLIADVLQEAAKTLPADAYSQFADGVLSELRSAIQDETPLDPKVMHNLAEDLSEYLGLFDDTTQTAEEHEAIINQTLEDYKLITNELITQGDLLAANTKAQAEFNDFLKERRSSLAEQSAQLQADRQGGTINPRQFGRGIERVRESLEDLRKVKRAFDLLATSTDKAGNALFDLAQPFGQLSDEAGQVVHDLRKVNGLQDAGQLSTQGLIERLYTLADTYNLNGKQIDKLGEKLNKLFKALETISKVRATFGVKGVIDLRQMIAAYKALNAVTARVVVGPDGKKHVVGGSTGGTYDSIIAQLENAQSAYRTVNNFGSSTGNLYNSGAGSSGGGGGGSKKTPNKGPGKDVSTLDLPDEIAIAANRDAIIKEAIRRARKLQNKIPGENKDAKNDIVELLKGTQRILEVRGVKDEYLRKALEELAAVEQKRLEQETKADTIRRLRVGGGDFASIANVPVNSRTGISIGGPQDINVTLNLNGTVLTPAQFAQFADQIAAAIKRQIAS